MTKILNSVAVIACKLLVRLGQIMGKKGSSLPGSIALKISPGILGHLARQVKKDIVLVCGTNGKTTTNNLIYSLLSHDGNRVVCNNVGANMLPGVACAFISMANIWGNLDADYASIECDEASARHIVKHLSPSMIVVTNLFRDQMDRYGEVEGTARLIEEALANSHGAVAVLNADDPYTRQFGESREAVYFGVSEKVLHPQCSDSQLCVHCENELEYRYRHYNQLGNYTCPGCGYKRPNPHYSATRVDTSQGLAFVLSYKGIQQKLCLGYRGFYNIYNLMAAFVVFDRLGGSIDTALRVFDEYKPGLGRMEPFTIGGKTVVLNLAKNPAGFNQALSTALADPKKKNILIAVNDMPSDGIDISWLWDTNFEMLADESISSVYVSGERRDDVSLRLKYAGIQGVTLTDTDKESLRAFVSGPGEVCYLIVNYTVLFDTQKNLKELEEDE